MDRILHAERLDGHDKRLHRRLIDELPDGVFVSLPQESVGIGNGAAGEPSLREAAGRVARDPGAGISAERKARGVGGTAQHSALENFPPPLTPPHRSASLHGGRGTQAATAVDSRDAKHSANSREAFVIRGNELLRWTPAGYDQRIPCPHGVTVDVLTPPSIIAALAAGYRPQWHDSAL
jgi:hypothetical protein